jgi:hypothetical protein
MAKGGFQRSANLIGRVLQRGEMRVSLSPAAVAGDWGGEWRIHVQRSYVVGVLLKGRVNLIGILRSLAAFAATPNAKAGAAIAGRVSDCLAVGAVIAPHFKKCEQICLSDIGYIL